MQGPTAPTPTADLVSLVICTRNRADRLSNCFAALRALTRRCEWEIVVVDNGSTDGTRSVVERFAAEFDRPVHCVFQAKPGLGGARNAGVQKAAGKIISFTDDDCYVSPSFVDDVRDCFAQNQQLGFVGGRVLLHDPTDYPITIQERRDCVAIEPGSFVPAGLIHGANFSFRRAALEAAGGFDEMFGAGTFYACEDVDMLARIVGLGWHGTYDPHSTVAHHHGRKTQREADRLMRIYDYGRGAYYMKSVLNPRLRLVYLRHWYWRVRKQPLPCSLREFYAALRYLPHAALVRAPGHRVDACGRLDRLESRMGMPLGNCAVRPDSPRAAALRPPAACAPAGAAQCCGRRAAAGT